MQKLNSSQVKKGDIVRLRDGTICEVMSSALNNNSFECRPTDEHPRNTRTGYVHQDGSFSDASSQIGCDIMEVVVQTQTLEAEALLQKSCQQSKCDTCSHQYQPR